MRNNTPATMETDSEDTYPVDGHTATPRCLVSHLKSKISTTGPLSFDQWMSECLYHPQWGYYCTGEARVGRDGDFFTSVSVGKCFGMLLAYRIAEYASANHIEANLDLIELGANTGQLACDILDTLRSDFPHLYENVRYTICEPLESMQKIQSTTLIDHSSLLEFRETLNDIKQPKVHGILLSNELIDAFPVKLITKKDGQWCELMVGNDEGEFTFKAEAIHSPQLLDFSKTLPPLPDGYTTEYRPGLEAFAAACASVLQQGMVLTIDYGYVRSDYYAERRATGTLRTFFNQTADETPLELAGEQDISAHVDFTQLAEAYQSAGFALSYFDSQSRFLIQTAAPWFKAIEDSQQAPPTKLIRQFQTLTHPGMMGNQFTVLECTKNLTSDTTVLAKLELTEND